MSKDRWVALYRGVVSGPKIRRFARLAGCTAIEALGILGYVWTWAVDDNADEEGLLKDATLEDIANVFALDIRKELDSLKVAQSLVDAGWLDEEGGRYYVHDWSEHQAPWTNSVAKKEAANRRKREQRERERLVREATSNGAGPPALPVTGGQDQSQEPPAAPQKPGKKGTKKPEPEKKEYAEFVHMTEAEYEKLVAEHGEPAVAEFIRVLDNYKGSSGKKYKSDYRTILSWVIEKVKEKKPYLFRQTHNGGAGKGLDFYDPGDTEGSL